LGAHPQVTFMAWLVFAGGVVLPGATRPLRRRLAEAVVIVLLAGLLGSVAVLPTAELAAESHRAGGLPLREILGVSFPPWQALTWLQPFFFGYTVPDGVRGYWGTPFHWELCAYLGFLPFVLAVAGLLWARGPFWRRLRWLTLLVFLLALGRYGGLYYLVGRLPGFSYFRMPGRFLVLLTPVLLLFAGWALEQWWRGDERMERRLRQLALAAMVVTGLAFGGTWIVVNVGMGSGGESLRLALARAWLVPWRPEWLAAGGVVLLSLAVTLVRRDRRRWVVPLVVLVDLTVVWSFYGAAVPAGDAPEARPFLRFLQAGAPDERYLLWGNVPGAGEAVSPVRRTLAPDANLGHGLSTPTTVATLRPAGVERLLAAVGGLRSREGLTRGEAQVLGLCGGRWLVHEPEAPLPGWSHVFVGEDLIISENPYHRPAAYTLAPWLLDLEAEQLAQQVELCRPDYLTPSRYRVSEWMATRTPGSVEGSNPWHGTAARPQVLVVSQQFFPGWRWFVNGSPVEARRVYGAFTGIALEPGDYTVMARYEPFSWRLGVFLTLLGLAGLAAAGVGLKVPRGDNSTSARHAAWT
jgi:hypothetical protein